MSPLIYYTYIVHSLYTYDNSVIFYIHTTKLIVIFKKQLFVHSAENDLVSLIHENLVCFKNLALFMAFKK